VDKALLELRHIEGPSREIRSNSRVVLVGGEGVWKAAVVAVVVVAVVEILAVLDEVQVAFDVLLFGIGRQQRR
jgi:hypothetical protein